MTSFTQLQNYFLHHLNIDESTSRTLLTQPQFTEAKISLSREKRYWTYGPGDKVKGKLVLRNVKDLWCCGIRVDLEVIVSVKFRDNDLKIFHSAVEDVLQPKVFTYVWPVNWSWVHITGKTSCERLVRLPASKHIFSFCFQYPKKIFLPGSFCSSYGVVRHQVVAYFQTPWDFIEVTSAGLRYRDYYNLSMDPVALSPLTFKKQRSSLFHNFVKKFVSQGLSFTMKLPRQGFLPGDESHFLFTLNNETGSRIDRILVSFIQIVSYHAGRKKKKSVGTVLDFTETTEADWAVETIWESSLRVPLGVKPTYRGIIEHLYFIKIQVFLKGKRKAVLKGHVPVIIGTTDNFLDTLTREASSDNDLLYTGHYSSASRRRRSFDLPFQAGSGGGSGDSSGKHGRCKNFEPAPPPSYSQLPSRASSVDTFPPMYDDAMNTQRLGLGLPLADTSLSISCDNAISESDPPPPPVPIAVPSSSSSTILTTDTGNDKPGEESVTIDPLASTSSSNN